MAIYKNALTKLQQNKSEQKLLNEKINENYSEDSEMNTICYQLYVWFINWKLLTPPAIMYAIN